MLDPNQGEFPPAVRLVLIASDVEYQVWSKEEVDQVRNTFLKRRGSIPTLQDLADRFDNEKLTALLDQIVQEKRSSDKLTRLLLADGAPCHGCGAADDSVGHEFGLVRVKDKSRDWSATTLSAALSAFTLPLLGAGALYGPSKDSAGQLLRLRLRLCPKCTDERRGIFGGFKANETACSIHPVWNDLQSAGFTKFVAASELKSWIKLPT
jgi:hypothetical protein